MLLPSPGHGEGRDQLHKMLVLAQLVAFQWEGEKKRSDIYMYLATITLSASKYQV